MLDLPINKELKKIVLRSDMPFYIMTPDYDREKRRRFIIAPLTEQQEEDLDNNKVINLIRGDVIFTIGPNDVEYYGIIDFSDDSADMDVLATAHWFNTSDIIGTWIPSNYNYEEHIALSDLAIPRIYDTCKPEIIAQYGHGCIGKPERCIIFKYRWL